MQTIGVLGGIGAQATMAFEVRFHHWAQERIPPDTVRGYPPLLVHYCRTPPVIVDETGKPLEPLEPSPGLLNGARILGPHVDFLVITANSPHLFLAEVEAAAGRSVLSMIEVTLAEIERRGWSSVGLLALGAPTVYLDPLRERGVRCPILGGERQAELDRAIFSVMEGRDARAEEEVLSAAISDLRDQGSEAVVLGCTELPLLLNRGEVDSDLIDPADLLAREAVDRALKSVP